MSGKYHSFHEQNIAAPVITNSLLRVIAVGCQLHATIFEP